MNFIKWCKTMLGRKAPPANVGSGDAKTQAGMAALIGVIEHCVAVQRSEVPLLIYISTPVTSTLKTLLDTGLAYEQLTPEDKKAIQAQYRATADKVAGVACWWFGPAAESPQKYINPFRLYIPGWGQEHYMAFWLYIILNYVGKMVMCPEWEYSAGCVEEYWNAHFMGIPCYDHRGQCIDPVDARKKILNVVARAITAGHADCQLVKLVARLRIAFSPED